ncbi:MAG TPA: hypothetical protein PKY87_10315 [Terricaulis sp.]|nr:hypothetical protein [Terricaulis sp.]
MLRTLVLAPFLAAAIAAPALADDFPESALHAPVVSDTGVVVGHVAAVERDGQGRIIAAEIPGQEPPSAPLASRDLVAEREHQARSLPARDTARREGAARSIALR